MKLQVLVLFILLTKVLIAQEAIKSWNIDPYTIQLFKYEQITEDVGMKIRPYGEIRSYYHLFDISKNSSNFQLSGHIRVNKDSSKLAFIELEKPRKTEGILGYDVLVNLQAKTVKINPISKPKWLWEATDSALIIRLSDSSTQLLSPRITESIQLFGKHESMNLHYNYMPEEWKPPYVPSYKTILYQGNKNHEILFYTNYYIMDGYVYSTRGGLAQASGFGEGFWTANLKVIDQERKKNGDQ